MAKRGPKGALKVKVNIRNELFKIFEANASVASSKISNTPFKRTRVRLSGNRVRDLGAIPGIHPMSVYDMNDGCFILITPPFDSTNDATGIEAIAFC